MRRRGFVMALAFLSLAVPAAAQEAPPLVDQDAERESFSEFWERALRPNREMYAQLVTQARALGFESSQASQKQAKRLFADAIRLAPDQPLAYWELGLLQERQGEWRDCAANLGRVFALEPSFRPEGGASWAFDVELGTCLAQAGDYRQAIAQFKRILARGESQASVQRLIGESFMALGELGRAIEFFEASERLEGRAAYDAIVSLAVAFDRDERQAKVHEHLTAALSRDPSLSRLASRTDFIPAADRYYYMGLAYTRKNPAWALIYFRHYLDQSGEGPWRTRATDHVRRLAAELDKELPIDLSGTAKLDATATRSSVLAKRTDLAECVASTPELLLRVKIRAVARGAGPETPRPGVMVLVDYAYAAETATVERAVDCVDRVATQIDLPRLSGASGTHAEVEFPVISTNL